MLILDMINDYINWTGTRHELISIINLFERQKPKLYKMFSKQIGKFSSVNIRRIQQFIDEGIIPKPNYTDKKYMYNFNHLIRYLSAIILRNRGYPMKIIRESLDANSFDFLKDKFVLGESEDNYLQKVDMKKFNLSERLKKLGRVEGKVLEIKQKKFAITPWFTVAINENKLNKLSIKDVDTLTEAVSKSLKSNIKK
tara:strand:- start:533 stop:1123 length:591 start_codon:yes stop_codon:yes gene_type:complete